MTDKCPHMEECTTKIRKDYYEKYCMSEKSSWINCVYHIQLLPRKTASEWAKE